MPVRFKDSLWDAIVLAFTGKRVAILGPREAGKTCLHTFLHSGALPETYEQTVKPEEQARRRVQLGDLDLKLGKSRDVPGDKGDYPEWKKLFEKADIALYLMRADELIAGKHSTEERARDDMKHIASWMASAKTPPRLALIGTNCDRDPNYRLRTPANRGDYVDAFRRLPVVQELIVRSGQAPVVLGSLGTVEAAEGLTIETFGRVM